jgi:hypothetical protein
MLKTLLFVILVSPFCLNAQLDEALFNEQIQGHGWHPTSRAELLFGGVFTIAISDDDTNGGYFVRLEGINAATGEKFKYEGKGVLRIENNYFEIALSGDVANVTKYMAGTFESKERIHFFASDAAFVLTEEGMKDQTIYPSRF